MIKKKVSDIDNLMGNIKGTMGVGVASMAGQGIMGSMVGMAPASAQKSMGQTAGIVGSGLQLANVGMLAKTGMGVAGMFVTPETSYTKKLKKK
jgi:hypothetical protein